MDSILTYAVKKIANRLSFDLYGTRGNERPIDYLLIYMNS